MAGVGNDDLILPAAGPQVFTIPVEPQVTRIPSSAKSLTDAIDVEPSDAEVWSAVVDSAKNPLLCQNYMDRSRDPEMKDVLKN